MQKRADLHCHSIYSEHPSEWFLQKIGAKESYTDPLFIYNEAKRLGMDYVTITDHNRIDGALLLNEKHPNDTFIGLESTTYFPEDKCKIHLLIYGISSIQFEIINHLRKDIYELRDYLKQEDIFHSVAHASYSVNGKLQVSHLEKLILLFDVFEGINGGRNRNGNLGWQEILKSLNPSIIDELYNRHGIEPFSDQSWIKGYTAGSDDHGGLFLGKTYTEVTANSVTEFLQNIQNKKASAHGRHNDYQSLAFTIYKIAIDFSKEAYDKHNKKSLLDNFSGMLFENQKLGFRQRFKISSMKGYAERQGDEIRLRFAQMLQILHGSQEKNIEDKLDLVYQHTSEISDAFFRIFLNSFEYDLKQLNVVKLLRNISSTLPGVFLLLPFLSSLKHMHSSVVLIEEMKMKHRVLSENRKRRSLWFSDTITDLNGVSATLKQMGSVAMKYDWDMRLVCSLEDSEIKSDLPENILNLPFMYVFPLPFYETYRMKIPSILKSLKLINEYRPDQVIISTPGPVGMLGLLAAKLSSIPAIGIYHTDFYGEVSHLVADESVHRMVMEFEKWFYNQMNEIRTPTSQYQYILEDRGISVPKMGLLNRGIELDRFYPYVNPKKWIEDKAILSGGITLMYAGRVSQDKSLDILASAYVDIVKRNPVINLIIAGSGPYLGEMKALLSNYPRVVFTGAMPRYQLAELYNAADFFVFPSVTDTFGMVILEALACGLPVIVSNQGGPQEIIAEHDIGFVCRSQSSNSWSQTIGNAIDFFNTSPIEYQQMRVRCSQSVQNRGDWENTLRGILGDKYLNSHF